MNLCAYVVSIINFDSILVYMFYTHIQMSWEGILSPKWSPIATLQKKKFISEFIVQNIILYVRTSIDKGNFDGIFLSLITIAAGILS